MTVPPRAQVSELLLLLASQLVAADDTLNSDPVTVAESQSETEQITPEKQDPSAPQDAGLAHPEEQEAGPGSPSPKPNSSQ